MDQWLAARRAAYVAAGGGQTTKKRRWKKPRVVSGHQVDLTAPPLPTALMDGASFSRLCGFAHRNDITQAELCGVYARYRLQFNARTHPDNSRKATKMLSLMYFQSTWDHTNLEPVSVILVPALFVRESHGLARPRVSNEIGLCRFVIAGYDFLRASPLGLLLKFFRLVLDYSLCAPYADIPVRAFEELVGLVHGSLNRALLGLMQEAFGSRRTVRFVDLVRVCVAFPPLLFPLFQFQRRMRLRMFGASFWKRHAMPHLDPDDEPVADILQVPPALERDLTDLGEVPAAAWRVAARRLCSGQATAWPPQDDLPFDMDVVRDRLGYRLAAFYWGMATDHTPPPFDDDAVVCVSERDVDPAAFRWIKMGDAYYSPALGLVTDTDPATDPLFARV